MKKFKFKNNYRKYRIIVLFIIFLIIFVILSSIKLDKSNLKIINYLLKDISPTENINMLTSNLNNILGTYYFKENNMIINNNRKPIIYLYNKNNIAVNLKNNLEKLGIEVILDNNKINDYQNIDYFIDIDYSNSEETIIINNKPYAKIQFIQNSNEDLNEQILLTMHNYLDKKYHGISKGIVKQDNIYEKYKENNVIIFKIYGKDNNYEEINNSTEIVSLMIYHILYDKDKQDF